MLQVHSLRLLCTKRTPAKTVIKEIIIIIIIKIIIIIIIIIVKGHWGWCLSLPRESGRSRPPEFGVTPLASVRDRPKPPSLGLQLHRLMD